MLRRRANEEVTARVAGDRTVVQAAILALVEGFSVEKSPAKD
jgi:hypothetical protein